MLHGIVACHTLAPSCTARHCVALHSNMSPCDVLCCNMLCCSVVQHVAPCYNMLHCAVLRYMFLLQRRRACSSFVRKRRNSSTCVTRGPWTRKMAGGTFVATRATSSAMVYCYVPRPVCVGAHGGAQENSPLRQTGLVDVTDVASLAAPQHGLVGAIHEHAHILEVVPLDTCPGP